MSELPARPVVLRPAADGDARRIWQWRNEPAARAASFNTDEVPWEVHERWFAARLQNPAARMFIACDERGAELGFVRFDLEGRDAEISVALDSSLRGLGWGRAVIRAASNMMLDAGIADRVTARVKADNPASLAAFSAAGFGGDSADAHGSVDACTLCLRRERPVRA